MKNTGNVARAMGFALAVSAVVATAAPTLEVLSEFGTPGAGKGAFAGLIDGGDGYLYGTTFSGGVSNLGTIYRVTPAGTVSVLHSFGPVSDNGFWTEHPLVRASDGNFYGVTQYGGTQNGGTVFKLTKAGVYSVLFSFSPATGYFPYSKLLEGPDGALYGVALFGGSTDAGVVYRVTKAGAYTVLHDFDSVDGARPSAPLALGDDGALYGVASEGGTGGYNGTVFRVTTGGSFTKIADFNRANGANPQTGLVRTAPGVFYGTTYNGGAHDYGTVFSITTAGVLTTVHSFNGDDGMAPDAPLVRREDGVLIGATEYGFNGKGTVFVIAPGQMLRTVYKFPSDQNHGAPRGGLLPYKDGNLYGVGLYGGLQEPYLDGSVFRLTGPLGDTTPNPFSFTASTNVMPLATVNSNSVTVKGIDMPAPIKISGGEYQINGGLWTSSPGYVNNGQLVAVRHQAAITLGTSTKTSVNIGGVNAAFSSTTIGPALLKLDTQPAYFHFTDIPSASKKAVYVSNAVSISGISGPAMLTIAGGEYSQNNGPWLTTPGVALKGDSIKVRHTSATAAFASTNTILTVGGVSDTFTTTTRP